MSNPLREITNLPAESAPVTTTPVKSAEPKPAKVKKAAAASKPKKATKAAAKNDYPSYIDMIREAILSLENPKNGVSRIAILKFITDNYDLEEKKANVPMKRALTKAVTDGILAQKSGVGANGSFRLVTDAKSTKTVAKPRQAKEPKPAKAKEPKPAKAKKEPATKKAALAKSKSKDNSSVAN